jgi:hypothetical protein
MYYGNLLKLVVQLSSGEVPDLFTSTHYFSVAETDMIMLFRE